LFALKKERHPVKQTEFVALRLKSEELRALDMLVRNRGTSRSEVLRSLLNQTARWALDSNDREPVAAGK
jgi:hypothetical protein